MCLEILGMSNPVLNMSASPSTRSEAPTPDARKRGRTACSRCKHRKQKCDGQYPICSNCSRAGAECDKAIISQEPLPASYTRALEDRVASLEQELASARDHQHVAKKRRTQSLTPPEEPAADRSPNPDLGDIVALISLGNPEEPAYIGPSSGLSLATILNDMVQATVWSKSLPEACTPKTQPPRSRGSDAEHGRDTQRRIEIEALIERSVKEPPDDELGARMVRAYLSQLHPRYPFLNPDDLWDLHAKRHELFAIASNRMTKQDQFGVFKLNLVYAIGATLVQLTDKKVPLVPESFYLAALRHISAARESRTMQNIEAMTLLVIYHLRSASSHGMWYMIGLAMRTCIDLGLHRRSNERNLSDSAIDSRRRLFWTVYALERTIAISLGRPPSLPDRQIDVELPDSRTDARSIGATALYLFRLRRLESQIQHAIYRVDKPLHDLRPKMESLYRSLQDWRAEMISEIPMSSPEVNYPLLHYHRAVRLLIQPFLPLMDPSDTYHTFCLRSAGDICQAHKRLHQSLDYGHSFIAVQTVFVAGMTLVYALWRWTERVWDARIADDIRACSLVLFVMGERAEWVRRYRDAFEVLVNGAMNRLTSRQEDVPSTASTQNPTRSAEDRDDGLRGGQASNWTGSSAVPSWNGAALPSDFWQAGGSIAAGAECQGLDIVEEMTNWIDQPDWMPNFDML